MTGDSSRPEAHPTHTRRLSAFLMASVTPFLRERGFRRSGHRYRAKQDENEVIVRFQSRGSMFTCDLAVVSALLVESAGDWEPPEHWTIRLGPIAVGHDKWWDLELDDAALASDFLPALVVGIKFITPLSSDAGLRDSFLRSTDDPRGMTPFEAGLLTRLVRGVGLPEWADPRIKLRDGSFLDLRTVAGDAVASGDFPAR